ncbi:LysM peptidoglycan-binding domain-containing protein [Clostridium sp. ZS2-4]|uniref:LysM peptidoglycan-binding domain-containing protein n=1 Tax=Clostridium sp. ZS2-4 TaxID=2987703 RepID=UPI00227C3E4F|nr:LysM peptidoglycan-binding domain-containing protein [Clostridium sp. ZS2-4]MCY6354241.1 hypothetical protein [Clostridium sp. ZS2-4]
MLKLTANVDSSDPTISYITHSVKSGDTMWSISIDYGIPICTSFHFKNKLMINNVAFIKKSKDI